MVPLYVRSLLPMFCVCFQSTMIPSIKRSSLSLIKKILRYTGAELLAEITGENRHLVGEVVEVMTSVLDQEEDDEGHLTCLLIVQDLMTKDAEGVFLEQFAKLGLFQKVHAISFSEDGDLDSPPGSAGSASPVGEILTPTSAAARQQQDDGGAAAAPPLKEDAKEIVPGRGYTWKEWSIARGRDCLYIWSDAAALELSNGSNGWFRFILDGKLATMYSSGSPEGGSDSSENRGEFLEKLQRARSAAVKGSGGSSGSSAAQPVLSKPSPDPGDVISVGNWNLSSKDAGALTIINSDGQQQATVLKEDLPGFVFQSNRGTKHTFTAETSLGPEFAAGWSVKKTKRLRGKAEAVKQRVSHHTSLLPQHQDSSQSGFFFQVRTTAREIYENYFRAAQAKPRGNKASHYGSCPVLPHGFAIVIIIIIIIITIISSIVHNCVLLGVVATLNGIVARVDSAIQKQLLLSSGGNASSEWKDELTSALRELAELLEDETSVSAFELHTSGLIQVYLLGGDWSDQLTFE